MNRHLSKRQAISEFFTLDSRKEKSHVVKGRRSICMANRTM